MMVVSGAAGCGPWTGSHWRAWWTGDILWPALTLPVSDLALTGESAGGA